jgi:hypothetical protein
MKSRSIAIFLFGALPAAATQPFKATMQVTRRWVRAWLGKVAMGALLGGIAQAACAADAAPCTSKECRFFKHYFVAANGTAYPDAFVETYESIEAEVAKLQAAAPNVTLGAMLSLVLFESGARLGFFNTRDSENGYRKRLDPTKPLASQPLARYSYQFGIVPVHTSLFRPCVAGAVGFRKTFEEVAAAQEFHPTEQDLASVVEPWKIACRAALNGHVEQVGPGSVDYYILTCHERFGVPVNSSRTKANPPSQAELDRFPLYSPRVTSALFFKELRDRAREIHDDGDAIRAFGGGDPSYATPERQKAILAAWLRFH